MSRRPLEPRPRIALDPDGELVSERAEVLVECATFCVLQTVGLDTAGATIPYMAGWGEDGALDAVQAFAARIDEVAKRIEDALTGEPSSTAEPSATAP